MFKNNVILAILFFWIAPSVPDVQKNYSISVTDAEFIFEVCSSIVKMSSKSPFFHVINQNRNFPITLTILQLHKNLIPTILIDHHTNIECCVTQNRAKNILFVLNNCQEILSLILEYTKEKKRKNNKIAPESFHTNFQSPSSTASPMYCDRFESNPSWPNSETQSIECDTISMSDRNLKSHSTLSDEMWNLWRPLYTDRIFNAESNLIFFIPEYTAKVSGLELRASERIPAADNNECSACNLLSLFRFMWRIFRGVRTVICPGKRICYRYDPFNETLINYMDGEAFEYPWLEKRRTKDLVLKVNNQVRASCSIDYFIGTFMNDYTGVFDRDIDIDYNIPEFFEGETISHRDYSYGLKMGADLIIFEGGTKTVEPSDIDVSFPVATGSLCFIAPRRGFMPQYLVPFSSFTLGAWIGILLTYVFCLLMHYYFKLLVLLWFRISLTESESVNIETQSSLWCIFCYYMCIAQPRLLLDRFLGGKIFFLSLIFSTQTLTVIFLGQMVTLVSTGVRLQDIESIEDLEGSDLPIQSDNLVEDLEFFGSLSGLRTMAAKLTNSLELHNTLLSQEEDILGLNISDLFNFDLEKDELKNLEHTRQLITAKRMVMRNDAFLVDVPKHEKRVLEKKIRSMSLSNEDSFSLHCVMDYPIYYSFSKYSLLMRKFNDYLLRLSESGQFDRFSKSIMESEVLFYVESYLTPDVGESLGLRAFTMADLSIGFICLVCGLSLSSFIFLIELLV